MKRFIVVPTFYILIELSIVIETFQIGNLETPNLILSSNSSNNKLRNPSKKYGFETKDISCYKSITISSSGPTFQVQRSILGTYTMTSRKVMGWPTWVKWYKPFTKLYRCPRAHGRDWMFGNSIGNNVGWIKHQNCTGCPESCSQDWMYWNGDIKQLKYDENIRVTIDHYSQTRSYRTSLRSKSNDKDISWKEVLEGIGIFIFVCFVIIMSSFFGDGKGSSGGSGGTIVTAGGYNGDGGGGGHCGGGGDGGGGCG